MIETLNIQTNKAVEFINITAKISSIIKTKNVKEGICVIAIPHTTAGITINENADPSVMKDLTKAINKIVPFEDQYEHLEGNSAAHLKASFFGNSSTVIINQGDLLMGTWQGIYFCEFDGPRHRKVIVKIIEDQ
ncbi:secondary thiamine-phosphate synthase enzyme [Natranaerovirga pectinivora]|uniref:Secondary thiamine-phosphate synthase enzyme n=1 Tax=Natranaerovirga pectinivora TaxID=682400 RepID=A0A4R3MKM7_9FIRM|nr:secondary thiamine-phosphate synthase enzyme YjbQ [Natranaerovirga pectinivora]TCT14371.1 secondary thiamine-phosphate synthase enzyme [Natranaerovirga pectinivora]